MKVFKFTLMVLAIFALFLAAIFVYKYFNWDRTDILNVATLFGLFTATVALLLNGMQYSLNKDKRLYETGEFRIEKVYKPKIGRIQAVKISLILNESLPYKLQIFELNPNNIHALQHHLIQYADRIYGTAIPVGQIYSPETLDLNQEINREYVKVLKTFHDGISNFSPWIHGYHRRFLSVIEEIRIDKGISQDQKESFISNVLLNDLLGYNMIVHRKNNNFKIVNSTARDWSSITTVGYIDFIKSILPTQAEYVKALGEFKHLFERDLPK